METTFHVLFVPKWAYWDPDKLTGISAQRLTKSRPSAAGVAVKFKVNLPEEAFYPLKIEAAIDVELEDTKVVVEVVEP